MQDWSDHRLDSLKNAAGKPSLRTSESIIARRAPICVFLTILFLLEAGKRRLSMMTLDEAFSHVRIDLRTSSG